MLTQEQIKSVLGTSNPKPKVLTDEDKVTILSMVENGRSFQEIVTVIQETNDRVKKGHVRELLKRRLRKLEKSEEK